MSLILNMVRKTELIISRQMFAHLYRMIPNNRYLSDDTGGHNSSGYSSGDENDSSDGTSDISETNSDIDQQLALSKQRQQNLENAKQKLSQLIDEMKVFSSVPLTESVISKELAKPVTHIRKSARPQPPPEPEPEPLDDISKGIDKRLVIAAKVIANTLSGDQAKQTESELLRLLREHAEETEAAKQGIQPKSDDLASIFFGMKVDHKKSPTRPGDIVREDDRKKRDSLPLHEKLKRPMTAVKGRVNLYVSESLGIFDADMKNKTDEFDTMSGTKMYIWDRLMKDEIEQSVTQSPKNAFDEMITWTEEGKLWKYPIDNEQGLEDEAKVPFYEHVMLDHLLEDFPERGPVRQFMELVLLGLSSNPYITVQRKKETVAYYKEYFQKNEGILKASGALS